MSVGKAAKAYRARRAAGKCGLCNRKAVPDQSRCRKHRAENRAYQSK